MGTRTTAGVARGAGGADESAAETVVVSAEGT